VVGRRAAGGGTFVGGGWLRRWGGRADALARPIRPA
jgi:hypothetical protein